jgi:hypothetical protein
MRTANVRYQSTPSGPGHTVVLQGAVLLPRALQRPVGDEALLRAVDALRLACLARPARIACIARAPCRRRCRVGKH